MNVQNAKMAQPDLAAVLARLQALEDRAEISALKARYARAADAKYSSDRQLHVGPALEQAARDQAGCFTEDGVFDSGISGAKPQGTKALYKTFLQVPWCHAVHYYQVCELQLQGDTACGTWLLWQIATRQEQGDTLLIQGRTQEQYRRTAQGWLIAQMRFESLNSICIATDPEAIQSLLPKTSP